MPIFRLLAINPAVAVMTGTQVKTEDMAMVVEMGASSAREAMEHAQERARTKGYRILAAAEILDLPKGSKIKTVPLHRAFPTDKAIANSNEFYVADYATLVRARQPGDFIGERFGWDIPIVSFQVGDATHRMSRIEASWGATGFGFAPGRTVDELYIVEEGDGPKVLLKVRRDETTIAVCGKLAADQGKPFGDLDWYHARVEDASVAASALFAAVRDARGLDPKEAPAEPGSQVKP